jgi:NADPH:quinone reductase-like Zn-dependent oxidoreductase
MATRIKRQAYRHDGLGKLSLVHEEIGLSTTTTVLIKVRVVSVNYRDANIMHGGNPWPAIPNGIVCSDAAGDIVAVGLEVQSFKVGDRVSPILDQASITGKEQKRCWLVADTDGVLADYIAFEEEKLVRIPDKLSYHEASLLPCAGLTAWNAMMEKDLEAEKFVLIQGTSCAGLNWES